MYFSYSCKKSTKRTGTRGAVSRAPARQIRPPCESPAALTILPEHLNDVTAAAMQRKAANDIVMAGGSRVHCTFFRRLPSKNLLSTSVPP